MKPLKKYLFPIFCMGSALVFALLGAYFYRSLSNKKVVKILENYSAFSLPTEIYDVNGALISEYFLEQRDLVPYNQIPKQMINAIITKEDQAFFNHRGMHLLGLIRAMLVNLSSFSIRQGGSTITQQTVKLLVLKDLSQNVLRKLREFFYAPQVEAYFSKSEILEKYLNEINLSGGVWGVKAACEFFFNKPLKKITPSEAAVLACIPQSPSRWSPLVESDSLKRKHKALLNEMAEHKMLSQAEADAAYENYWTTLHKKLISRSYSTSHENRLDKAPYFSEYVRREMEAIGIDDIYTGGYKIYTTLDLKKQILAQAYLNDQIDIQNKFFKENQKKKYEDFKKNYTELLDLIGVAFGDERISFREKQYEYEVIKDFLDNYLDDIALFAEISALDRVQQLVSALRAFKDEFDTLGESVEGAVVSINPQTGFIEALVGGSGFTPKNSLIRAYQAYKQPGSAFKAILYTAAINSKIVNAASAFDSKPVEYIDHISGRRWTPRNFDGEEDNSKMIRIRSAIRNSINTIAVKVLNEIKSQGLRELASDMMDASADRFPEGDLSMALGTVDVTPLELCKAYSVIANYGAKVKEISILKVINRFGKIVKNYQKEAEQVEKKQILSPAISYIMIDLLKEVTLRGGTATGAMRRDNFTRPCFGKTGTTQDFKNAWFSGCTPDLCTTVYLGFDSGVSLGSNQQGGRVAAPVWAKYMREALKGTPVRDFYKPSGTYHALVCAETGLSIGKCHNHGSVSEIFISNTSPKYTCQGPYLTIDEKPIPIKALLEEKIKAKPQDPAWELFKSNYYLDLNGCIKSAYLDASGNLTPIPQGDGTDSITDASSTTTTFPLFEEEATTLKKPTTMDYQTTTSNPGQSHRNNIVVPPKPTSTLKDFDMEDLFNEYVEGN